MNREHGRRWLWLVAVLSLFAGGVSCTGCGDDDDSGSEEPGDDAAPDDDVDDDDAGDDTGDDADDDTGDDDLVADDPTWTLEYVDRAAPGNRMTGLKVGADGVVHVVYTGCSDARCEQSELFYATRSTDGTWTPTVVDAQNGDTGWMPSLALNEGGNAFVVYANHATQRMWFAFKPAGGDWSTQQIGQGRGGWWTACALSGAVLHVAHTKLGASGWDENWAQHGALDGGAWTWDDIETTNGAGWFMSMDLDPAGLPVISYTLTPVYPVGYLKLARMLTGGGWAVESIDADAIKSDVEVDPDGFVHLVYSKLDPLHHEVWDLAYATDAPTGSWSTVVLDGGESEQDDTGEEPRITSDRHGGLHVSYRHYTAGDLRYARKVGEEWEFYLVDAQGDTGLYSWIEADAEGNIHISYERMGEIHYAFCPGCGLH